MNARDFALYQRFQARVSRLSPYLAKALLDAWDLIRDSLTADELERLLNGSDALLDRAFIPVRDQIQAAVRQGFRATIQELPKAGKIDGTVAVNFDTLNPRVIDAVRTLDSRVINTLKTEIRETVKAYTENALRDGVGPAKLGRELRPIIGLAPNQYAYVENLRTELETGNYANAAQRKLLDRRFNLQKLDALTGSAKADRIDLIVNTYRKSALAFNASTNARTATLDSMKLGQQLSWQDAIDKGIADGTLLTKRWSGVMDSRERPEHVIMEGETVPFDYAYSNGEYVPGESTFNCRCISIFSQSAA